MLDDFYSQGVAQLNLFDDNAPRKNSEKLMEDLDQSQCERRKRNSVFCRAWDPDCLADEAGNAFASLYYEVL
ncbi:DNA-directed DNA polymerase [Klebsiella pneumoniae]|uniref:DNA-directed DNA polymerase n=1 Tax=Klebsiella pneumoniae TaxID=573 RepID=A0A378C7Y8_KLEPN|nr:DNA-directed DNA polymerase [Klebsiella pneumoniae]